MLLIRRCSSSIADEGRVPLCQVYVRVKRRVQDCNPTFQKCAVHAWRIPLAPFCLFLLSLHNQILSTAVYRLLNRVPIINRDTLIKTRKLKKFTIHGNRRKSDKMSKWNPQMHIGCTDIWDKGCPLLFLQEQIKVIIISLSEVV